MLLEIFEDLDRTGACLEGMMPLTCQHTKSITGSTDVRFLH